MNIVQGINYCFRVRAKNSCANGMWSHEKCDNVCAVPLPASAPTLVRKNDNEITVEWENCRTGSSECTDCSYELEIIGQHGVKSTETIYNRNQYTVYSPASSTPYSFRVKCISYNCGEGDWSLAYTADICTPPVAPVCPEERCPANMLDSNGQCRDNKIVVEW
jgi:hypothetical protein